MAKRARFSALLRVAFAGPPPRVAAMDVYLPIANLAVNGLVIIGLGALTGLLSGMFGVGGTP